MAAWCSTVLRGAIIDIIDIIYIYDYLLSTTLIPRLLRTYLPTACIQYSGVLNHHASMYLSAKQTWKS